MVDKKSLLTAIHFGNEDLVLKRIDEAEDKRLYFGGNVLLEALICHQFEAVRRIIASPNFEHEIAPYCDFSTMTLLMAIIDCFPEQAFPLIESLISLSSYNCNVKDKCGQTPITLAATYPSFQWIVDKLLARNDINVNITDWSGMTAFGVAIYNCNYKAAHAIMEHPTFRPNKPDIQMAKACKFPLGRFKDLREENYLTKLTLTALEKGEEEDALRLIKALRAVHIEIEPSIFREAYAKSMFKITKEMIGSKSTFEMDKSLTPNERFLLLIESGKENEAIELLKQEGDDFDVNFGSPILLAVQYGMLGLFEIIVNHPSFDSTIQDGYGEPLFSSLEHIYTFAQKNGLSKEQQLYHDMINIMLDSPNVDFNTLNLNKESALTIAAQEPNMLWIFKRLITMPTVDVNAINDIGISVIGNAIRNQNRDAIELICKREDLKLTDSDLELAAKHNIDLKDFLQKK